MLSVWAKLGIVVCVAGVELILLGVVFGGGFERVRMMAWVERDERCWRWVNATGQKIMSDPLDGGENYTAELRMCRRAGIIGADEGGYDGTE